jgi:gag-polypeptide of LTR copia-type
MSVKRAILPTIKFDGKRFEEFDYELRNSFQAAGCDHLVVPAFGEAHVLGRPILVTTFTGTQLGDEKAAKVTTTPKSGDIPSYTTTETKDSAVVAAWDDLNSKGLSILRISITFAVSQCLPPGSNAKSLLHSYHALRARYGRISASTTSIDCHHYFRTIFDETKPFTQQIDELDEIYSRILAAGIEIPVPLRAMRYLSALPPSYDNIRESINCSLDSEIKDMKPETIRARILSAETTRNNGEDPSTIVAAIQRAPNGQCNWCLIRNHTESQCKRKNVLKMTKEQARADAKRVRREKETERDNSSRESEANAAGITTNLSTIPMGSVNALVPNITYSY